MRWIAIAGVLIVLSGSKCSNSTPEPAGGQAAQPDQGPAVKPAPGKPTEPDRVMTVRGTLTNEGVECPALRSVAGELFTLSGNIGDFRAGDQVCVKGHRVEMSICQQGVTIAIDWIGKTCPD